jgi:hypothetical protein
MNESRNHMDITILRLGRHLQFAMYANPSRQPMIYRTAVHELHSFSKAVVDSFHPPWKQSASRAFRLTRQDGACLG